MIERGNSIRGTHLNLATSPDGTNRIRTSPETADADHRLAASSAARVPGAHHAACALARRRGRRAVPWRTFRRDPLGDARAALGAEEPEREGPRRVLAEAAQVGGECGAELVEPREPD